MGDQTKGGLEDSGLIATCTAFWPRTWGRALSRPSHVCKREEQRRGGTLKWFNKLHNIPPVTAAIAFEKTSTKRRRISNREESANLDRNLVGGVEALTVQASHISQRRWKR